VALPCLTTRACRGPAAVRGRDARWRRGGGARGRRGACRGDGAGPAAHGEVEVGTGPASPGEEDRGSPRGFAGRDEEEGGRIRAPPGGHRVAAAGGSHRGGGAERHTQPHQGGKRRTAPGLYRGGAPWSSLPYPTFAAGGDESQS
jgi:hypothetical protein